VCCSHGCGHSCKKGTDPIPLKIWYQSSW
jgi:hypothetical protein